jgi:hypothetical protein
MSANVYVKPLAGSNKVAYFVGHAPSDPDRSPSYQLGAYFIRTDSLHTALCIARSEADRLGGEVIVCQKLCQDGWVL